MFSTIALAHSQASEEPRLEVVILHGYVCGGYMRQLARRAGEMWSLAAAKRAVRTHSSSSACWAKCFVQGRGAMMSCGVY